MMTPSQIETVSIVLCRCVIFYNPADKQILNLNWNVKKKNIERKNICMYDPKMC